MGKKINDVFGIRARDCRMVDADKFTGLWGPAIIHLAIRHNISITKTGFRCSGLEHELFKKCAILRN